MWERPLLWFAPAIALLSIVTIYPLLFVLWMSLTETRYYEIVRFIGLANYFAVLSSSDFLQSSLTSLTYVFGSLALAVPVGLASAVVFNELGRFAALFRVITLLPWTLSMGVVASLWLWLLNPSYGPVVYAIQLAGFSPGLMLGDPDRAIWFLVLATA
jgi:multiple sugar transport system permease protein